MDGGPYKHYQQRCFVHCDGGVNCVAICYADYGRFAGRCAGQRNFARARIVAGRTGDVTVNAGIRPSEPRADAHLNAVARTYAHAGTRADSGDASAPPAGIAASASAAARHERIGYAAAYTDAHRDADGNAESDALGYPVAYTIAHAFSVRVADAIADADADAYDKAVVVADDEAYRHARAEAEAGPESRNQAARGVANGGYCDKFFSAERSDRRDVLTRFAGFCGAVSRLPAGACALPDLEGGPARTSDRRRRGRGFPLGRRDRRGGNYGEFRLARSRCGGPLERAVVGLWGTRRGSFQPLGPSGLPITL